MSEAKRTELIAAGVLNDDGSRKDRCPTCGTAVGETLTQERYDELMGGAGSVASEVEPVVIGVNVGALEPETPA